MDTNRDDGSMDFTESTSTEEVPNAGQVDPQERSATDTEFEQSPRETEKGVGLTTPSTSKDGKGRFERNLKKFLENGQAFLEIRSCRGRAASERLIKSDGYVAEKVDCSGNMTNITYILSKVKLQRSSAPPTYNSVTSENNSDTRNVEGANVDQSASGGPLNSETPISKEIRNATDFKLPVTPVTDFKLPVTPSTSAATTPCEPPILIHFSPGSSRIQGGQSTPVMRRPTVFNFQPRKAFYMFSPEGSGILRQCQSLPNINKEQRKDEKHYQRRSLILDERSRIVRSLFKDEPGQATPETKRSMVPQSHIPRPSAAKDASDRAPLPDIRSKICRKLNFAQDIAKVHSAASVEAAKGENPEPVSPGKRKEISTPTEGCPPEASKKVRISPTKDSSDQLANMREDESNNSGGSLDTLRSRKEGKDESSTSKEK